jgi:glutamine synthetase
MFILYIMLIEYVWLDGDNNPRSKTRVLNSDSVVLSDIPIWNYDGSSTKQADGSDSEVLIHPQVIYQDPFRKNNNIIVLCDTYNPDGTPHATNTRSYALKLFNKKLDLLPMFGIEQEFFLTKEDKILGWHKNDPKPQGEYYCGNGASNAIGRTCIEDAFQRCLDTGLQLTGLNAEVAPSQWEFQVCATGIDAADQLIMMRYILNRTAELHGLSINYHPKPIRGDWNGSGCHTNFSTKPMRVDGGYSVILDAIKKLENKHKYHMEQYGTDNQLRMTGLHETASYDNFSYGVANRGASIRIPRSTEADKKGYLEDRRPSSNMDPYIVTSLIFETSCL